jgi:hypothetical protein
MSARARSSVVELKQTLINERLKDPATQLKIDPRLPKGRPGKRERLDYIIELMVSNRWVTGITGPMLASIWGLAKVTVDKDAAEASRQIGSFSRADREQRKALWLANLESARAKAYRDCRMESVKGLLELEGKAFGFFEPERHSVDVEVSNAAELAERIGEVARRMAGESTGSAPSEDPDGAERR